MELVIQEKELRKPRGVIFDLGGTVLAQERFDPVAGNRRLLEMAVADHGLTAEAVQAAAEEVSHEIDRFRDQYNVEFSVQAFQRLLYETLGVTFKVGAAEAEREFWRAAVTLTPTEGISEVLDMLAANQIKTGVLSNTAFFGTVLEEELARHGLAQKFSFVATSADYGLRKPNPRVFKAVLGRMGLVQADVWFVGDKLDYDVRGAVNSGMCAVWYNPENRPRTGGYDCLEVKSWREFMTLLRPLLQAHPLLARNGTDIGLAKGKVHLADHKREWAGYYLAESECIRMCAADLIIDVQHVGSTAVPGLVAKPILDIAIAVPDRTSISGVVERLTGAGYKAYGDTGKSGGYLLARDIEPDVPLCHVHIVEVNDPQWRDYIAFRDILRHETAVREAYQELKKRLAAQFPEDRESYTAGKDAFIRDVLVKHGETLQ